LKNEHSFVDFDPFLLVSFLCQFSAIKSSNYGPIFYYSSDFQVSLKETDQV